MIGFERKHAALRILFCTDYLIAGGVERQVTELATNLDRARYAPILMCLYADRANMPMHFGPNIEAAGIPLYSLNLGWSPADKVYGVVKIAQIARMLKPDILHAVNYHGNLLSRLARPFLPRGTNLIGSVRGNYTAKQLLYERLSHHACVRVVTNGLHLREQLVREGHLPANKVIHIANGVDTERFARNPLPGFREQIAPGVRCLFLSVGRISTEKRMHLLPEALGLLRRTGRLSKLDNATLYLIILGTYGDAQSHALLEKTITENGLDTVVKCHHETHQPEAYYHAADVVILFSPAEGMPNVVLEALAAGRPVIISEAANAAGIIDDGVTGWVVPTGNVSALADAMQQALDCSPENLERMGTECRRRAQDFSMSRMVHAYEQLYDQVALGRRL